MKSESNENSTKMTCKKIKTIKLNENETNIKWKKVKKKVKLKWNKHEMEIKPMKWKTSKEQSNQNETQIKPKWNRNEIKEKTTKNVKWTWNQIQILSQIKIKPQWNQKQNKNMFRTCFFLSTCWISRIEETQLNTGSIKVEKKQDKSKKSVSIFCFPP